MNTHAAVRTEVERRLLRGDRPGAEFVLAEAMARAPERADLEMLGSWLSHDAHRIERALPHRAAA